MKKRPRGAPRYFRVITILLGVLTAWLLIEGISAGILRKKGLDPLHSRSDSLLPLSKEFTLFQSWAMALKPFPLFGYLHLPASDINNFGFYSIYPFPYQKKEDEYVIGILGGSVAQQFAQALESNHAAELLKENLPHLAKKKIVFLNLSLGGFQQPQQFIIFSYFIEMFDMIIQIDGWNEAWIQSSSSFPANFPAFSEILYSRDLGLQIKARLISISHTWLIRLREALSGFTLLARSSFLSLLVQESNQLLVHLSSNLVKKVQTSGANIFNVDKKKSTKLHKIIAQDWRKYTEMEIILAKSRNIPAYFFVQPSQYIPHSKRLSPTEKLTAFDSEGEKALPIFDQIRTEARFLNRQGLSVFDLNGIFRNESETLYIDSCCHLNEVGLQKMIIRIFNQMGKH